MAGGRGLKIYYSLFHAITIFRYILHLISQYTYSTLMILLLRYIGLKDKTNDLFGYDKVKIGTFA